MRNLAHIGGTPDDKIDQGNTEGSRELHARVTARKNQKLIVTDRQIQILVGCLLGDAYISPRGQIQIAQSSKDSQYVYWKYKELKSLSYGLPTEVSRFDKRFNKSYSQTRFWLRQFFRNWRRIFYPKGKKIFPLEFENYFSALTLAVWYMDDGNYSEGRNVKIATDGFDLESREHLKSLLLRKFNIESTLHKNGKLRISNKSLLKFFKLVKPFVHSSMKYKVP